VERRRAGLRQDRRRHFTPTDVTATPPVATGPAQVIVKDGVVLEPARKWRVTVNNFMAAGGDGYTT
jgi:5'-nucleotidase